MRLHLLPATQLADGSAEVFLRDARVLQNLGGGAAAAHEGQQHHLQADELVALLARQLLGARQDGIGFTSQVGLAALHTRQTLQLRLQGLADGLLVDRELTEQELNDLLTGLHDGGKQMLRLDGLLPAGLSRAHGLLYGLLRFDGKLVEIHIDRV